MKPLSDGIDDDNNHKLHMEANEHFLKLPTKNEYLLSRNYSLQDWSIHSQFEI